MNSSLEQCEERKKKSKPENRIYRIISFQRLAELLLYKKNTLVDPAIWEDEDPFEGWIAKQLQCKFNEFNLPGKFFAQCWTSKYASDAMWNIYSNGTDGIRIRTTVDKLKESIKDQGVLHKNIYKIAYKDASELDGKDFVDQARLNCKSYKICALARTYTYKRKAFEHEGEFRLICYLENWNYMLYSYCIYPNELIDQIKTHPRICKEDHDKLKCTLKRLGFTKELNDEGEDTIVRSQYLDWPPKLKFSRNQ